MDNNTTEDQERPPRPTGKNVRWNGSMWEDDRGPINPAHNVRLADTEWHSQNDYGWEIMTVGQLRRLLADVPADTHVVMDDNEGWYLNIKGVTVPALDPDRSEMSAVTLWVGETLDSRQF